MLDYPDTVHFRGLNRPLGIEANIHQLDIEGRLPREIEGAFFRAVPDRQFAPMSHDDVILSHDGMIAKLEIKDGGASYAIKYVQTARYLAERAAGRALFDRYRNPFTDDPSVSGVDRTVSNTTPIWHGGRLFMTKEDGRAYEVNPHTLETVGSWNYHGALRSETMTAHARIDPASGDMYFFGYEAAGLCTPTIAYAIADRHGDLVSEQWFDAPYCAWMHDFVITESFAVFPVFPTIADLDRLKAGGAHWKHEQNVDSWIGVMPRDGKIDDLVWFKGPKGVHSYHMMNAFQEGSLIHMDMCLFNTNMIPFVREDHGLQVQTDGALVRWTMDLTDPEGGIVERKIGPLGEMPRIRDQDQGRNYRFGWYLSINPEGGPLLAAGPAGIAFNLLLRVEVGNGGLEGFTLPPSHAISEPVHIPAEDSDHEGWLMAFVDREVGPGAYQQEVWIFDAGAVANGPVAKIFVPIPGRPQVHGTWVPAKDLENSRLKAR